MTAVLQAQGLSIGYGKRVIGTGLELNVQAGEVVALLGANGSGKTTLLQTLLGLQPPLAGELLLCGRPLASYSAAQRARLLAYVPQSAGDGFAFTVLDMVLMGRVAHLGLLTRPGPAETDAAMQVLERLGIRALASVAYPQLSGGQQQLVLLARALLQEPQALLLDEPTASLDFANQILVLEQIATLREQGLAVLLTTHQPEHALRLADRLLLFKNGRIQREGTPGELANIEMLAWLYDLQPEQVAQHMSFQLHKQHD